MQRTKKIIIAIISIVLILIGTKVNGKTGTAISETVRIRKENTTNSGVVGLVSQGEEVEIIEEKGEWYKVKYKNDTGYIRKDMLKVEEGETSNTSKNETTQNTTTNNTVSSEENTVASNETNTTAVENTTSEGNTTVAENTIIGENTVSGENVTSEGNTAGEGNTTGSSAQTEPESENSESSEGSNTVETTIDIGKKLKTTTATEIKIVPLINSSVIKTIEAGKEITVVDVINKWCHIETEESSGWVLISKLNADEEAKEENKNEITEDESKVSETEENKDEDTQEGTNETKDETTSENENQSKEENNTNTTTETTKYVSTETLNVRKTPDNNAEIINHLTLNTEVTVVEKVDSTWAKIKTKKIEGYVAIKYLSDNKVDISSRSESKPRENAQTIKEETTSQEEKVAEETTANEVSTGGTASTKGEEIVSYAKQYLGSKYVSGGTSPQTGFDCSGFTYYVYKHFGITLNRTSTAQNSNGTKVEKSNLAPGDLLIFNNSSNSAIGHVGIYIGGNTFIHAANSSKGVITTSLSSSYYVSRYVGARRVIN